MIMASFMPKRVVTCYKTGEKFYVLINGI